ncbi:hypothetical protein SAMN05444358_103158 [Ruegeria halocynthiae]|uniref:Uncharacterized protein n=1 Tax=Ruegeria halocynthiae TaxID=985054 RepID=A0A1H2ZBF6_9RHOB|nr:hypothetical protein [Ruegeria halocynthiae]SDX14657.1 hypothetical protein SAMN05444358_103158 [Ruegeria halocynthiae]
MSKLLRISTATGLLGLVITMTAALSGALPTILGLGFVMAALGLFGALVGAAASLRHVWQSTH